MLKSAAVEAATSSAVLGLALAILAGCDGPTPVIKDGPGRPAGPPPAYHHEPERRIPPDLETPIVLEYFSEPFIDVDPYYLGRETIAFASGRWRVDYSLETGSGWSEGLQLPGLATMTVHPPHGDEDRDIGRPGVTHPSSALTDGPSLGVIAILLSGYEMGNEEEYKLPARDLRQGVDYDLELKTGGWSEVGTAWGERRCLEVTVLPQGYVFRLDETGWPWSVRWPGGYAERAEYEPWPRRKRIEVTVEESAPETDIDEGPESESPDDAEGSESEPVDDDD